MRLNLLCTHCGTFGSMELGYAYGWEATCLICGCIQSVPKEFVPTGLQPRDYSSISTESPSEAHSPFHLSGGMIPRRRLLSGQSTEE